MTENINRRPKKSSIIRYNVLRYTGISALYKAFTKRPEEVGYKLEINSFDDFKVAYREGTTDIDVIQHSFDKDIFFPGVPEYNPSGKDVILDVGAHIGTFSLLAAVKSPNGKVYSIEACKESYNYCYINTKINNLSNVEVCNFALYDSDGKIKLNYDTEGWGHSIMSPLTTNGEEVQTLSMESFFKKYEVEHCHFAKFNCEGAEFPILMGTPKSILTKFGILLILYHLDLAPGSSLIELERHLQDSGFSLRYSNVHPNGKRGWLIAFKPDISAN